MAIPTGARPPIANPTQGAIEISASAWNLQEQEGGTSTGIRVFSPRLTIVPQPEQSDNPGAYPSACRTGAKGEMANEADPLAQFGLEAIDLRWTLRDVAARRSEMINKAHLAKLIELDLVAMRGDAPYLTVAGQSAAWGDA